MELYYLLITVRANGVSQWMGGKVKGDWINPTCQKQHYDVNGGLNGIHITNWCTCIGR